MTQCQFELRQQGKAYPRTCELCGLGPCKKGSPIEQNKDDSSRSYIPLVNGWEIQTKGKGSTFRIAHVQGPGVYDRWAVVDSHLHWPLEKMARDIHAALASPVPPPGGELPMTDTDVSGAPGEIWLEPACAKDSPEGRTWCEDNIWPNGCDECQLPAVKYVRADRLRSPGGDGELVKRGWSLYSLGETYFTQGGARVKFVEIANPGTSYETMADEDGIHRYTRRDYGRVTGSPHDYSDPRNVPPPSALSAAEATGAPESGGRKATLIEVAEWHEEQAKFFREHCARRAWEGYSGKAASAERKAMVHETCAEHFRQMAEATSTPAPVSGERGVAISEALSFFASAIKSGEGWTATCDTALRTAQAELAALRTPHGLPVVTLADIEQWHGEWNALDGFAAGPLSSYIGTKTISRLSPASREDV